MSLDQNLFTLHVTPNKDNPHIVDLIDPSGTIHYRKHRLPGVEYKAEVYDPISQSLLISATSPNATSKTKILELYNPTILVELKYTGTLSFRWSFNWEEHNFEWKREECYMLRKPDPPVLVAVTKEPAGRLKTTTVQILDYNLNRFDINDRKGLEIVILTALLTFSDVNEGYHMPQETTIRSAARTPMAPTTSAVSRQTRLAEEAPPPTPPKPEPKTGVERIAEIQASLGDYNEIFVEEEGQVRHYAEYCSRLLEDDAMLFVTIRSAAAEQVPKVLQVVQETKRIRYKAGLSEETDLHQYVVYDEVKKKGPRRINLDDVKPTTTYTPPTSLTVHLSKIDMPELQPKASTGERLSGGSMTRDAFKDTSRKDSSPGKDSKAKDSIKKDEKKASRRTTPPLDSAKLIKGGQSPSPSARGHAQAHDYSHPHQPSPSPPHPTSYASPPAEPPSRPTYDFKPSDSNPSVPFPAPTVPGHGALNTGWDRPNDYYTSQPLYGPGAYVPSTHHTSAVSGPAPSGSYPPSHSSYSPSYLSPPPPSHPSVSSRPSSPSSGHKPSMPTSLLDSFWRR
ncbi:hypothetical protein E4T56_gene12529 [Termitomyces sp. T112]|nr:hypothetical protein C0989_010121 [Termitomyces sp. Mn162]KAG5724895.1 hypothetical protein E4T56_gene12529 [Termitomyces sp. T112]